MIINNAETILSVQELNASIDDTQILNGFDITVKAGEIHAIMGPNGSGKSTFSKVVAGHPSYTVGGGTLEFQGKNLMDLEPDERAKLGIFLGFSIPLRFPA
jgi:Fe-S cluster assembly ATP-binding protein